MNKQGIQHIELGISLFLLFIGLIFSVTASIMFYYEKKLALICTEPVNALVTEIEESSNRSDMTKTTRHTSSKYSTIYIPVFEYTVNGEEYTEKSEINASPCPFNEGDTVEIYYNPENPKQIYVKTDDFKSNFIYFLFIDAGVLIIIYAIVKLVKAIKGNK